MFNKIMYPIKIALNLAKPLKLALIVRGDLKLTKGKTAAQCSHAAVMCFQYAQQKIPTILKEWLAAGQPKIVLRVQDLNEIEEIYKNAKEQEIICAIVRDAGRTQVEAGTITVLGIGPNYEGEIDKLVKHLKLL